MHHCLCNISLDLGLFSPLLRLLATHFPQLCLVEDWMYEDVQGQMSSTSSAHASISSCTPQAVNQGKTTLHCSSHLKRSKLFFTFSFHQFGRLSGPCHVVNEKTSITATKSAVASVQHFHLKLPTHSEGGCFSSDSGSVIVARVQYFRNDFDFFSFLNFIELYRQVWLRLNSILPRQLWVMTVNALRPELALSENCIPLTLTQDHLVFDPLHVLRCDQRVFRYVLINFILNYHKFQSSINRNNFRCPPAMQIVLYMLKAWLGASRTHLSRHLLDKPLMGPIPNQTPGNLAGISSDIDREELKTALIATQESAVVQIVLEICLETEEDQVQSETNHTASKKN